MVRGKLQILGTTFAGVFLLLTIVALVLARHAYQTATSWVEHTNQVKLAIDDARIHLDEIAPTRAGDLSVRDRFVEDLRKIRTLTSDNPRQQARLDALEPSLEIVVRARDAQAIDSQAAELRGWFDTMLAEEDALMSARTAAQGARGDANWLALGVCGSLATVFAAMSLLALRGQSRALARQSTLFAAILENMGDGVLALDVQKRFLVVNAALRRIFGDLELGRGVSTEWVRAHKPIDSEGAHIEMAQRGPVTRALSGEVLDDFQFSLLPPDATAERRWVSATCRPVRDEEGEIVAAVGIMRDVTRERQERALLVHQAEELRKQSLVDELTGLYNRRGFLLLAEQHARTAQRTERPFAILFADVNGLKVINDTLGHDAGDDAIRRMATILKTTLRDSDVVARLGGDEYVALVDGAEEPGIAQLVERLLGEIEADESRERRPFKLSASMGVAYQKPGGRRSIDDLLAEADRRMYQQKGARRVADRAFAGS